MTEERTRRKIKFSERTTEQTEQNDEKLIKKKTGKAQLMEKKNKKTSKKIKKVQWSIRETNRHEYDSKTSISSEKMKKNEKQVKSILKPNPVSEIVLSEDERNNKILELLNIKENSNSQNIESLFHNLPEEYQMYIKINHGDLKSLVRKFPTFKKIQNQFDKEMIKQYYIDISDDEIDITESDSDEDFYDSDDEAYSIPTFVRRSSRGKKE